MIKRFWQVLALAGILLVPPALAQDVDYPDRDKPDIDLYALMSDKCAMLKIAGRDFPCRAVAYFHSEKGRANFTVAVDDPVSPGSKSPAFPAARPTRRAGITSSSSCRTAHRSTCGGCERRRRRS